METINQRLKKVRMDLGYNQRKFSEILGIQQSHLSAIEAGKKELTIKILQKLVNKFNISPIWILEQRGEKLLETIPLQDSEKKGITELIDPDKRLSVKMSVNEITFTLKLSEAINLQ